MVTAPTPNLRLSSYIDFTSKDAILDKIFFGVQSIYNSYNLQEIFNTNTRVFDYMFVRYQHLGPKITLVRTILSYIKIIANRNHSI